MVKRMACIALCLVMVLAAVASAEGGMSPMFTYTAAIVASLKISDGTAQASGAITPYDDLESSVTVRLQKYTNGTWVTIMTWLSGKVAGTSEAGGSYTLTQGYDYRVYVIGNVYNSAGTVIETVTKYTTTKSY